MKNDAIWQSIPLSDIFTYERGKEKNMASLVDGNIPLVSARNVNNGVKCFVGNPSKVIQGGNVITLNNDGDGGAGLAYYQAIDFALDTHVTALWPQERITSESLLYMTTSISKQHAIFGHGRSISLPRAERLQDMLPVTNNGKPDYKYMSDYVREHRKAMLSKYRTYVAERISELGNYIVIPPLHIKQWAAVAIPDIFGKIQRGKRLKNADHMPGNIPYVSSTANNNGVDDYVTVTEGTRVFKNCISLANSGSVGTAFYEPFDFVASDHVTHLERKNASKYLYLFLATMLEKQKSNFNFNREINDARIQKLQIMLPITGDGQPDYEYMEQYSKNMMLKKYKQYLAFLDAKEKETPAK